jgi:hypothetical protein
MTDDQILQIIPAPPGWTFKYVWVEKGLVRIASIPLIGQALIRRQYRSGPENYIEFYGYNNGDGRISTATSLEEDANDLCNGASLRIFSPGEEPTEEELECSIKKIFAKEPDKYLAKADQVARALAKKAA